MRLFLEAGYELVSEEICQPAKFHNFEDRGQGSDFNKREFVFGKAVRKQDFLFALLIARQSLGARTHRDDSFQILEMD